MVEELTEKKTFLVPDKDQMKGLSLLFGNNST